MEIWELLLIAVGLSMDAFAVAMCRGVEMKKFSAKYALLIALFFGVFQALMPLIGFYIAGTFAKYIEAFDHWIAFVLLAFIGGKMIYDSFKKDEEEKIDRLNLKQLFLMAIATSIDALAVGVTFAFLNVNIFVSVGIIGAITFALSFLGVFLGHKIGSRFKNKAEFIGGLVLIAIGIKILLEHLISRG